MDSTTTIPFAEVVFTPIEFRRWLGMRLTVEESWDVYVTTRMEWQASHTHEFEVPSPEGVSACTGCGATAWSLTWIQPALKCTDECGTHIRGTASQKSCGTGAWVKSMLTRFDDLVMQSAQHLLERELGAVCVDGPGVIPFEDPSDEQVAAAVQVVLAGLDPSEPARRPGLPIPAMQRGVTS